MLIVLLECSLHYVIQLTIQIMFGIGLHAFDNLI